MRGIGLSLRPMCFFYAFLLLDFLWSGIAALAKVQRARGSAAWILPLN